MISDKQAIMDDKAQQKKTMKSINIYRFIITALILVIILFFNVGLGILLLVCAMLIPAGIGFLIFFMGGVEIIEGINIWRFVIVTMMAISTIILFLNVALGITLLICTWIILAVFGLICIWLGQIMKGLLNLNDKNKSQIQTLLAPISCYEGDVR